MKVNVNKTCLGVLNTQTRANVWSAGTEQNYRINNVEEYYSVKNTKRIWSVKNACKDILFLIINVSTNLPTVYKQTMILVFAHLAITTQSLLDSFASPNNPLLRTVLSTITVTTACNVNFTLNSINPFKNVQFWILNQWSNDMHQLNQWSNDMHQLNQLNPAIWSW